jgi:hypothetical protein
MLQLFVVLRVLIGQDTLLDDFEPALFVFFNVRVSPIHHQAACLRNAEVPRSETKNGRFGGASSDNTQLATSGRVPVQPVSVPKIWKRYCIQSTGNLLSP